MLKRTHACGQLQAADAGREVVLAGWAYRRRDHGTIIFIDLRDRYGVTQIVITPDTPEAHEAAQRVRSEFVLAVLIGINFSLAVALMGKGMLLLGTLGASVGWGIQQAMQMTGNQALGFISGEWRGVAGKPRHQMYLAIALLIFAALVMAYGNALLQANK